MKTILCPDHLKSAVYRKLARENNGIVFDVEVKSLHSLLTAGAADRPAALLLSANHLLTEHASSFPIYRDMFVYPEFLRELLEFAGSCVLFDITAEDLPSDTEDEAELKEILRLLMTLDLKEKSIRETAPVQLERFFAQTDRCVMPSFETDPYYARMIERIEERVPPEHFGVQAKSISLHHALNTRQELEAVAQKIILDNDGELPLIILADYRNQLPVLEQVFERYRLPFCAYRKTVPAKIPAVFRLLVEFGRKKDVESLIPLLSTPLFAHFSLDRWLPYLKTGMVSLTEPLNISSLLSPEHMPAEHRFYRQMEDCVNPALHEIRDALSLLRLAEEPKDILAEAYKILRTSSMLKQPAELHAAHKLRELLNQCLPYIEKDADLDSILYAVLSLKETVETGSFSACLVTDLTHPFASRKKAYLLGCSSGAYPAVPVRKGLFDEAYVARIEKYPGLEERYSSYMKNLEWVFRSAETVYISYATNDYEGRENQLSYEIEHHFPHEQKRSSVPWPILCHRPSKITFSDLDSSLARRLFADEHDIIRGSVSSVEQWFRCPFSYFLNYGLKLREPVDPAMNSAMLGTLQHAFMEHIAAEKGKHYPDTPTEETEAFLQDCFKGILAMDPQNSTLIHLTEKRLLAGLQSSLRILREAELSTLFKPLRQEFAFEGQLLDRLNLKGIIDRVDESNGMVRVIDYKSSEHKMELSKMKAGLELQLLTYMIVASEHFRLQPNSMFYYSLREKSAPLYAADAKTKQIIFSEADHEPVLKQAALRSRQLFGQFFVPAEESEKAFFSPSGKTAVFEEEKELLLNLYAYFVTNVSDGKIEVDPVEGACAFCAYKAVCRNQKPQRQPKPILSDPAEEEG